MNDDDITLIPANDTPPLAYRGERGKMRASDSDRDRVVELLNVASSATWPGIKSSGPESRGLAWR